MRRSRWRQTASTPLSPKPRPRRPAANCSRCRVASMTRMPLPQWAALVRIRRENEKLDHGYTEEELNRLDAAEAERIRQQREMEELERSLAESRRHINSYAYDDPYSNSYGGNGSSRDDFASELEEIQRRSFERQKAIEAGLGFGQDDEEEKLKSSEPIQSLRQSVRKRSATAQSSLSSHKIQMPRSSTLSVLNPNQPMPPSYVP